MSTGEEINEQTIQLAKEILSLSRDSLYVNLRFLGNAFYQLIFEESTEFASLATDGKKLYFAPWYILNSYKNNKDSIMRDYLHVIFHCLFQHRFVNFQIHHKCWNLACDIAVENVINDLQLRSMSNPRLSTQQEVIYELFGDLNFLPAEKIYRFLLDENFNNESLDSLQNFFYIDDHSSWYIQPTKPADNHPQGGIKTNLGPHQGEDKTFIDLNLESANQWKEISARVQVDLETLSCFWGDKANSLFQAVRHLNREKFDYSDFLKRFSVLGEEMHVNEDEFDLVFYTYGLHLYKNLPLIEPLEYKEVMRVKEFVIAIDTSGSVEGELVQAFIQQTYNILKQSESFFNKINVHIIQCDAAIQQDDKISNDKELEQFIQNLQLRGFGGTDFRPVFNYVDKLIDEGEFENLKGLIYFTDGFGTYPTKKPNYDTAFVFLDDHFFSSPDVPAWAIKLILRSEDFIEKGTPL